MHPKIQKRYSAEFCNVFSWTSGLIVTELGARDDAFSAEAEKFVLNDRLGSLQHDEIKAYKKNNPKTLGRSVCMSILHFVPVSSAISATK